MPASIALRERAARECRKIGISSVAAGGAPSGKAPGYGFFVAHATLHAVPLGPVGKPHIDISRAPLKKDFITKLKFSALTLDMAMSAHDFQSEMPTKFTGASSNAVDSE